MNQDDFDNKGEECWILEDTRIEGDVGCDKNMGVNGFILGNVTGKKRVFVAETGVVDGNLDCGELYLEGRITGNVSVARQAFIGKNAEIKGALVTAGLEIVPGAKIGLGLKLKNNRNNQKK